MLVERRPFLLRYVIALLIVGTAVSIASLLPWRADPSHFTLFFLAVMVSAWYGGLVAGLVATVLSASSLDFFFIAPIHSIDLNWQALMRLSVFSAVAAITGYLTAARRHAEGALRQHQAVLGERVQERTAELAQANTSLHAEIAERKRAENELFKLQLQMGHVERSATLGRLTGTIAHELGTPLNSVLGYTQLLAQDELSEQARRRLNIIETQIHRMEEIIQHYLSHTRGASPKNEIEINALIRETLVLLQPIFQQRKIAVTAELCDALPTTQGDSISLRRVLINLINNSLDASAEGGKITIRTLTRHRQHAQCVDVTIEITDCGIGIPKEILPKIFDLFVTTKPFGKGTGLGLDICQEIIKAHGGTIHITSEVGQGTTVSIHLPAGGSTADLSVSEANL
jgi:signal transduction histidine kinase